MQKCFCFFKKTQNVLIVNIDANKGRKGSKEVVKRTLPENFPKLSKCKEINDPYLSKKPILLDPPKGRSPKTCRTFNSFATLLF